MKIPEFDMEEFPGTVKALNPDDKFPDLGMDSLGLTFWRCLSAGTPELL